MKIAILFNERPVVVAGDLPDDMFEEYDSRETINHIASAIRALGLEVELLEADGLLGQRLQRGKYDMAFNIAEGPVHLVGRERRCRAAIPALACELAGVPHTGSDALTLALTLDKALSRRVVAPAVPIAAAVLLETDADERQLPMLTFPVIVKPNDEGSSKGIGSASIAHSTEAAVRRARWLRATYGCPVLVEEFLPGTEVTVAVKGNAPRVSVLGMMEIAPALPSSAFLYSLAVKRDYRNSVRYHVPPRLPDAVLDTLRGSALTAYQLLGCRDLARLDFRLDATGVPRFIECNPLPGLHPHDSDVVILSRAALSYDALVQGVLIDAARRTGVPLVVRTPA